MACVYIVRSGSEDIFKIGRTKGDAEARIKKLQTGNPQELTPFDVIETKYEKLCETYLHNRLRTRWRGGEFFAVNPTELEGVIRDAREFLADFVPKFDEAKRLAAEESNDRILSADDDAREAYRRLLEVREALDNLDLERTQLETMLKLTMGTAAELDGIASWKTSSTKRFDLDAFKLAEPMLYEQYVCETRGRRFCLLASRNGDLA